MKRSEIGKLDKEWSLKVREKDNFKCQVCGLVNKRNHAHHVLPKHYREYRWSIENGLTLCAGCHKFGKHASHQNPIWFVNWLIVNKENLFNKTVEILENEHIE